jgi:hypothetical protein
MRNTAGATKRYTVGLIPTDFAAMVVFLATELNGIETALNNNADGFLEMITVAPSKPRDGMIRFAAAGVLGASKGYYGYHSSAWNLLG